MCGADRADLAGTAALEYIEWGESEGFDQRSKVPLPWARWWDLGNGKRLQPIFYFVRFNNDDFLNKLQKTEMFLNIRRALDDIIFDALNLTQGERDGVYEAVIHLVETRLQKASSLKGG